MYGKSDSPSLIIQISYYSLPYPPDRISAELEALLMIEFLDCFHESDVSFAYQILNLDFRS